MDTDPDERILALAEPYMCSGEQAVMQARVVREQPMRALQSPPSVVSTPTLGQMIITNFSLIFLAERSSGPKKETVSDDELWWSSEDIRLPLSCISRVEAKKGKFLRIHCKDFRLLQFTMPFNLAEPSNTKKQMELTIRKIDSTIRMFAFSGRVKNLFAFAHELSGSVNGWDRANTRKDLQRIGLPTDKWRISDANQSYLICPTYPSVFAVPSSIPDITLHKVSAFRSKGRIPILSWLHPKNGASITRSAQPLVGIGGSRSTEDEHLVKEIIRANPLSALVIMDARPKVNAAANKARGAGYEVMSHYAGQISGLSEDSAVAEFEAGEGDVSQSGTLEFLGIDNIHVMRESEKKLRDICYHLTPNDKAWLTSLDNTKWLDFVSLLLACARRIVLTVEAGISIFTHCSDGWDRTSQLTALSMLCLDPYYRTIEGFATLIEREWLAAGHKFHQRYGHGDKHYDDSNRSPIFPQFIECVYQLLQQFPTCFEFNEEFLITILDALYSCQYGTFLCNSEKERNELHLHSKTVSLWTYTDLNRVRFTAQNYSPYNQVLIPQSYGKHLKFWSLYFCRYCRFNEQNPDRWFRPALNQDASTSNNRPKKKKDKKHRTDSRNTKETHGDPTDLLQHLAEREKWKKDLANREAELKRMKELAEKNMEYALRLKSRAIYERKRAAFFRDRIDQITHQGSEHLECQWEAEWKQRLEAGADEDDEDDIALEDDLDSDDDATESETESSTKASSQQSNYAANGNSKKQNSRKERRNEDPDEIVELFIQPSKPTPAVPKLPPASEANRPPSPPLRRPPPPPGGSTTPQAASRTAAPQLPRSMPQTALKSSPSGQRTPGSEPTISLASSDSRGMSIHRQLGNKLAPLLMRRPTRDDLVSRKILMPQEDDTLGPRGSVDNADSVDELTDEHSVCSPRGSISNEIDDMDEAAELPGKSNNTMLRTPIPASARSGISPVSAAQPGSTTPTGSTPSSPRSNPVPVPTNAGQPTNLVGDRSSLTSSGSSSWMRNKPAPSPQALRSPVSTFTSAQHRSGAVPASSTPKTSSEAPTTMSSVDPKGPSAQTQEMPKRGLVQRFVSEKNMKAADTPFKQGPRS